MRLASRPALAALLLAGACALPSHARAQGQSIVAVVNGDVVSQTDVENRGKLFALSTGMGAAPDVLARLRPQVTRQLIDEKLRLQETQRRHIVVQDAEIADAIKNIEDRNGMPAGALRAKLGSQGVAFRTLVDQIRVQIGWSRVLRQELGDKAQITDAEVDEQMKRLATETGQPEYRVAEIFIPIDNPANAADARRFADTVIGQLRAGAPFSVVAAQFSQSQNALQGGDDGWQHADQLDPQVAQVAAQMPPGAISNPIEVPGGITIVTLRGKREIGRDLATMLSIRQLFLPFSAPLNPQAPTDQQRHQLDQARGFQRSLHSCEAVEAASKEVNSPRQPDPGEVRLEGVNPPQFRAVLASLPIGQPSQPLVSSDGIALVMVCARDTKNVAQESKDDVRARLLGERVELASRQLQRDLQRRAVIDQRSNATPANTASR
jgi:peptidyl-prolyl cis-trans isomerase SurA